MIHSLNRENHRLDSIGAIEALGAKLKVLLNLPEDAADDFRPLEDPFPRRVLKAAASYRPLTLFSFRLSGALCAPAFAFLVVSLSPSGFTFFVGI